MGTVFGKNKTSSSITVAGHKTYYIDSTDAEIVEVEGQGGGGSSSSDDATGTISGVTLPTAHSYTGVSFDSLRYYVKGTLSNTGSVYGAYGYAGTVYYGTITWTDETLGDLTDKITVTDPNISSRGKQTVFRIIFINSGVISGYHPWDDNDAGQETGQISAYSYNNGVHSITFYATISWYGLEPEYGCIQFRYLDGTTTFQNLNAFDLVNVSSGTLSKATSTDRYNMYNVWNGDITLHALYGSGETIRRNAFKYLLSGTPYWYVIDGEHDTWTDDLSVWGYSEVPVGPVLPEVEIIGWKKVGSAATSISPGEAKDVSPLDAYDIQCCYGVIQWQTTAGTTAGRIEVAISPRAWEQVYVMTVENVSSSTISFLQARVVKCSDSTATIVTVYNASNVAYNAFLFTANGTDYYYVLDGTQTNWTDNLSGLGYSLTPATQIAYFYRDKSSYVLNDSSQLKIIYDSLGSYIDRDASKGYSLVRLIDANGSTIVPYDEYGNVLSMDKVFTGFYDYNSTTPEGAYGKLSVQRWYWTYDSSRQNLAVNGFEYTVS